MDISKIVFEASISEYQASITRIDDLKKEDEVYGLPINKASIRQLQLDILFLERKLTSYCIENVTIDSIFKSLNL